MARQRVPVQINQFVGGINTEANPLNFPPNASFDEQNMAFNTDGSRSRRDGFNVEDLYVGVDTGIVAQPSEVAGRSQFRWHNPGGDPTKQLLVVQIGNYIGVHDLDEAVLSDNIVYSTTFPVSTYTNNYDYAVVDGILVVATGEKEVHVFEYDSGTVTMDNKSLLIRDMFGVQAIVDGVDLTEAQNMQVRPTTITDEHLYNLRNQTFAIPRVSGNRGDSTSVTAPDAVVDSVQSFYNIASKYQSNSDSANPQLYSDTWRTNTNRTVERYHRADARDNPGTTEAPKGYFIIDALERGTSRIEQEQALRERNTDLTLAVTELPNDTTPGGATVLEQYAGRVWYAGFEASVVEGDSKSPRMSSYVLFSQIVEDSSQINLCYQEADPTSHIDPDLVATDGGFIKLDGAYGIQKMVAAGTSLFVFALNGVWRITGGEEDSFNATSYSVARLSTSGCVAGSSVVVSDSGVFYWGEDDIFSLVRNEFGDWKVENVSKTTINRLFAEITSVQKSSVVGYFDLTNNSIRWLYGNQLGNDSGAKELILNTKFGAYSRNLIEEGDGVEGPFSVSGGQTLSIQAIQTVTVEGEVVTVGGEDVTVGLSNIKRDTSSSFYCIVLSSSPTITYTFGGYKEGTIKDWVDFSGGVNSAAFLLTSSITGGDARLRKDVPYVTTYFKQTEEHDSSGPESSCLLSSRWDWTTAADTGKWSNPRQAYRRRRFVQGDELVITRNKIRGHGRSVAFRFEAEDDKALILYGWEFNLQASSEE